jgi:hypothetical protein
MDAVRRTLQIAIAADTRYTPHGASGPWYDDAGLRDALEALGHRVTMIGWEDPTVDLHQYDAIYVSSTWSGWRNPAAYLAWLDACEADGRRRLINDRAVIATGFIKAQLWQVLEPATQTRSHHLGSLTPSRFYCVGMPLYLGITPLAGRDFAAILADLDRDPAWAQANLVLKPIISADGVDTFVYNRMGRSIPIDAEKREAFVLETFTQADAVFQRLAADPERGGVLVQPYMPGVETGEYSLTFLGGVCTHAVRKPPLFKGDGSVRRRVVDRPDLPPRLLAFAEQVLGWMHDHFGADALSRVRIDLFDQDGEAVLCELECADPNTNIRLVAEQRGPDAAQAIFARYATVIADRVASLASPNPPPPAQR